MNVPDSYLKEKIMGRIQTENYDGRYIKFRTFSWFGIDLELSKIIIELYYVSECEIYVIKVENEQFGCSRYINVSKRYFDNFYNKINKIDFEKIVLNSSDGLDGSQFEIIIGNNNGFNKYSKKIGLWSPPCTRNKKSVAQINELLRIYEMIKKRIDFKKWYDNILLKKYKSFLKKYEEDFQTFGKPIKPIIGVIPLWDEKQNSIWIVPGYMQSLEEAGAIPMLLPLTTSETVLKQSIRFFDGFLFTGGHDVNPKLYGQEKAPHCGESCDIRDKMEAYIFREAVLNQNKPALGICRGIQLFNVLLGGNLYQDIPTELPSKINHAKGHTESPAHNVRIIPSSPLHKLVEKECLEVNSSHHQGIKRIADDFEIMAVADDGLVEAVCIPDRPYVWAVQWHPELSLKDEISKKIFSSFVKMCHVEIVE